jgi:molecular chaperone DnaK
MSNKKVIGIDLGTTNSEVSIILDGKPRLLEIDGSAIVPSVVSIGKDGTVLVGNTAVNNEMANQEGTIRLIKRKMGREEVLSVHGKDYTPPMISSLILAKLKKAAEDFLQETVTQAVITVPAFFTEKQREATKQAGELAGLEVLRLLNEPTAAALTYSLGQKNKELNLVYDLGGGTFDVSIVDLSEGVMEVRASDGDVELGGSDFDLMIANEAKHQFLQKHGIDLSKNPLQWSRILRAAEKAKIRLSSESEAEILEEFIAEEDGIPLHLKVRITRAEFESWVRPVLERTIHSVRRALKQASCEPSSLDRVILVGGSTYIPLVGELLKEELGIVPQAWMNPETVVAQGASVESASLTGQSLGTIMLDITPHSVGIETLHDYFVQNTIMIHRNAPLPYTTSRLFYKTHPAQDAVSIKIFQGESPIVEENQEIDTFLLEGLKESDGLEICVKMEMDRSGILHITATDVTTGKSISHTVKKESDSRMKTMKLADMKMLKLQSSETPITAAASEIETSAETVALDEKLIARALQTIGKLPEEDRKELQETLEAVQKGESPEKLKELLYYLD